MSRTKPRQLTADDEALLRRLAIQQPQPTWEEIGERFGMSGSAIRKRYNRITGTTRSAATWRPWTDADDAVLLARGDNANWSAIGRELGRSAAACKQRYNLKQRPVSPLAAPRDDRRVRDAAAEEAQRLRRDPPQHRSITAWLCGDPLPGRSALDEMRAGAAQSGMPAITLPGAALLEGNRP